MKNKWIIFSILIVAEILVLSGIVLVVWQGVSQTGPGLIGVGLSNADLFSAQSEEEWQFDVGEVTEITLESSGGDVIFEASQTDQILVTAQKTAWHSTKAKAQAELEDLSVSVSQTGNKIIIRYKREPAMFIFGSQQIDTVDFIISVPEGMDITAETDFGEISSTGKIGASSLSTDFGNIELSGAQGNLEAMSSSGDITVEGVRGKNNQIDLSSDFGEIELSKSTAASVIVHSNSGTILLNDVKASEQINLSSDFGKLEFSGGSADIVELSANSGKIILSNLQVESNLTVHTDFGDILLDGVTADLYDLNTNSGKIEIDVLGGEIKAYSDFGDLDIQSTQPATIDLFTKSGTVEYTGPLGLGPHSLATDFGDISMYLPQDTAITFDLETDFGKLKTEFPITLEGDVKPDHWSGTINDGGAALSATTNSGDISFVINNR
jgi:DUF4097 and DUF4098 domain-containing protein YvlB